MEIDPWSATTPAIDRPQDLTLGQAVGLGQLPPQPTQQTRPKTPCPSVVEIAHPPSRHLPTRAKRLKKRLTRQGHSALDHMATAAGAGMILALLFLAMSAQCGG